MECASAERGGARIRHQPLRGSDAIGGGGDDAAAAESARTPVGHPAQPSRISEELLRMFRLWRAGRLDKEIPCSANQLYQAEPHFSRVLGDTVLAGMCGERQSET